MSRKRQWKTPALLALVAAVVLGPILLRPRGDESLLAGDDTLIVISPHNEAIRSEFGEAFRDWYKARNQRTVRVEWITPGGTSETTLYLGGAYTAAFENHWKRVLGKAWTNEEQSGFMDAETVPGPSARADTPRQAARRAFLDSNVGCRIDVFFGGGSYDFKKVAASGLLVDCGYVSAHPELFGKGKPIPPFVGGEQFYDEKGRWLGTTMGAFGIASNLDQLARLGLPLPDQWDDLADPRFFRGLALANPIQSGSANKAFEMLIQQQMNLVAAEPGTDEQHIVTEGWARAMRLLQRIGANARYFTESSSKIALDVEAGEAAAGMTIDFYGRFQSESVRRPDGTSRIAYVDAKGGTSYGVDPIGILRGAPHPQLAREFVKFVMTDGQKIWGFKAGVNGGPKLHSLRRLPLLPQFYTAEYRALRSDPDVMPYEAAKTFSYDVKRTGPLFATIAFVIRVMCIDTHQELTRAWQALIDAKKRTGAFPPAALAAFSDISAVDYAAANGRIRAALGNRSDKIAQVRLAKEIADTFRARYQEAARLAREGR